MYIPVYKHMPPTLLPTAAQGTWQGSKKGPFNINWVNKRHSIQTSTYYQCKPGKYIRVCENLKMAHSRPKFCLKPPHDPKG